MILISLAAKDDINWHIIWIVNTDLCAERRFAECPSFETNVVIFKKISTKLLTDQKFNYRKVGYQPDSDLSQYSKHLLFIFLCCPRKSLDKHVI